MIKIGKKNERFADFVKQSRQRMVRCLTLLSIKNDHMPLVEVVNRLIMCEFMNGFTNSYMTNMTFSRYSAVGDTS